MGGRHYCTVHTLQRWLHCQYHRLHLDTRNIQNRQEFGTHCLQEAVDRTEDRLHRSGVVPLSILYKLHSQLLGNHNIQSASLFRKWNPLQRMDGIQKLQKLATPHQNPLQTGVDT